MPPIRENSYKAPDESMPGVFHCGQPKRSFRRFRIALDRQIRIAALTPIAPSSQGFWPPGRGPGGVPGCHHQLMADAGHRVSTAAFGDFFAKLLRPSWPRCAGPSRHRFPPMAHKARLGAALIAEWQVLCRIVVAKHSRPCTFVGSLEMGNAVPSGGTLHRTAAASWNSTSRSWRQSRLTRLRAPAHPACRRYRDSSNPAACAPGKHHGSPPLMVQSRHVVSCPPRPPAPACSPPGPGNQPSRTSGKDAIR